MGEIIFVVLLFCVVLSWTDFQSHVVYAVVISSYEGWWKFPAIWFQSFFFTTSFLRSGKTALGYELITKFERAARMCLSGANDYGITVRGGVYMIGNSRDESITFSIPSDDSITISGYDRLVPPRIAFLMLACVKKYQTENPQIKKKNTILD
jgi:hypothetical protein